MENGKIRNALSAVTVVSAVLAVAGLTNLKLGVSRYEYFSEKLPQSFDGFKILHISDLHSKCFGVKQKEILKIIGRLAPDMTVLTGDIIDEKRPGIRGVEELFAGLCGCGPIFYASGNHELRQSAITQTAMMRASMKRHGITDLDNSRHEVKRGDAAINVYGIPFAAKNLPLPDRDIFNILLYHGSGAFGRISAYGYDLVFSGHTHGGVVRLPFIGGVLGNDRRLFPEYDAGMFTNGSSTLISSRGLGDAAIPRFFNPPELVLVTLRRS